MIDTSKYNGKTLAIFGLGKAGASATKTLSTGGAKIIAWDENADSVAKLQSQNLNNVIFSDLKTHNWENIDALILSPGVPLTNPKPHWVVEIAKAQSCPIICDIEVLYNCKNSAKFIGITGTNGKSTTTSLISHILQEANVASDVGGNLGFPALELKDLGENSVYVIEMSSYQLDLIKKTHFDISILLNITPDHIDRHGSLQGYINAKKHIYDQQSDDVAIISVDDEHCAKIYSELTSNDKIKNIIAISVEEKLAKGISIIDDVLYDNFFSDSAVELPEFTKLAGKHNAQNIAASYAAARSLGIPSNEIIKHILTFAGLAHRMQYVCEKNGVKYINDSKATNAEAAAKALGTFDNIYWIAGGVAKDGGIEPLLEFFPKIKKAYLIGQAQSKFAQTLKGKVDFVESETIENAAKQACEDALASGGVVLLSPACASFDQWPNFEARGNAFCDIIKSIA